MVAIFLLNYFEHWGEGYFARDLFHKRKSDLSQSQLRTSVVCKNLLLVMQCVGPGVLFTKEYNMLTGMMSVLTDIKVTVSSKTMSVKPSLV